MKSGAPKGAVVSWYHGGMKEVFMLGEEDLGELAEKVASALVATQKQAEKRATVILLEGDLGAGKTTFTKALATHLGIPGDAVHSPTFILKKEYAGAHPIWKRLIHIDAYRFTHPDEAKVLRLEEDLKDPHALIVVEWPSRMTYMKADMTVAFEVHDERTRGVTLTYEEN
jgi:tRNA threonylcarbamoyladenosine biosynthesis protein TsaE